MVCATDAGREGELIFRYIYEAAQCRKPFSRLWISSLTPEAIRKGFDALRPGADYDPLADAARGRSRADWLVGMNLSRAYSLAYDEELSVGRVQTPTLAMVVERELAIRRFVPEDYLEVVADFPSQRRASTGRDQADPIRARGFASAAGRREPTRNRCRQAMRLPADGEEANRIVERARTGQAAIESIEAETQRMAPPLLYDLTELQRHANRLFGFSAQKTLDLAQALYETPQAHQLSAHRQPPPLAGCGARPCRGSSRPSRGPIASTWRPAPASAPLGRRFVDDSKVTDHHAIIPTATSPAKARLLGGRAQDLRSDLPAPAQRLARRPHLVGHHRDHRDYEWRHHRPLSHLGNRGAAGRAGRCWISSVEKKTKRGREAARKSEGEQVLPPGLAKGQPQEVIDVEALKKKTRPPKRFTEATLLTAMETAGKTLDEKELSDAMKETGLGTPATRAAIIEVLLKRGYIVRRARAWKPPTRASG